MASRLDRLITLLDTGSNPSVRFTAAKQLATAARRCLPEHVLAASGKKPSHAHAHAGGEAALAARHALEAEGWADVLRLVGRVAPFLASRSADTRNAAVEAIGRMAEGLPRWTPLGPAAGDESAEHEDAPPPPLDQLDVQDLVRNGAKLAATEYTPTGEAGADPGAGSEASKRDMLRSLGIGDPMMLGGAGAGDDLLEDGVPNGARNASGGGGIKKRELSPGSSRAPAESGPPATKRKKSAAFPSKTGAGRMHLEVPGAGVGAAATSPGDIAADPAFAGISARQINLLKRKIKSGLSYAGAVEEAHRMRGGSAAGGHGTADDASVTPAHSRNASPSPMPLSRPGSRSGPPGKVEPAAATASTSEAIVIDPAANMARNAQRDGLVNAGKKTAFIELVPDAGVWPWQEAVDWLTGQLAAPNWESRHGAALALRDIIKHHGDACGMRARRSAAANVAARERCLLAVAQAAVRTLVLDRFGDFVGDQLVAPVREAVSQTLGSVLKAMAPASVEIVHAHLIDMIHQPWCASATKADGYAWEVRHAGLLGLMYEVAVRPFPGHEVEKQTVVKVEPVKQEPLDVKMEEAEEIDGREADWSLLESVVDAAILGLGDNDDDVRSVAASCLVPVSSTVTAGMSEWQLTRLLDVLWSCLDDRTDDLGSSAAAVLDLLSRLVGAPAVVHHYSAAVDQDRSLANSIPLLFPFFRHTIASVRLATAKSVASMLAADLLAKDWLDDRLFRLLFENLMLEERSDVRSVTLTAWRTALAVADRTDSTLWPNILPHFVNWFSLALAPINGPLPRALFLMARTLEGESHIVDKGMMAGDMSLLSWDIVIRNRLEATDALAEITHGSANTLATVNDFTVSTSALQLCLCGIYMQSKAQVDIGFVAQHFSGAEASAPGDRALAAYMDLLHNGFKMPHYFETTHLFDALQRAYTTYLDPKVSGNQTNGSSDVAFSLDAVERLLAKGAKGSKSAVQASRMEALAAALDRFQSENATLDTRVRASAASAIIACRSLPLKLNPLIQSLVKGLKAEIDEGIQGRFAKAVASLVALCIDPSQSAPMTVANKLVTNLATLLCQDETFSPQVADATPEGIISHRQRRLGKVNPQSKKEKNAKPDDVKHAENQALLQSRVTRRGAQAAISAIIAQFDSNLFDQVPRLWEVMTESLLEHFSADGSDARGDTAQDVVDCVSILRAIIPSLSPSLAERVARILPQLRQALQSSIPLIRHSSSLCIASLCCVVPLEGMTMVVERIVPLLADVDRKENRQGAIESIYHIVTTLDMLILPYVLFLVVPVLGRMSDPDEDVRLLATITFASLIRLVPLEEDIPDPAGFPEALMVKRETQRAFLMQLLDGSKVDQYEIPVAIEAELRAYQKDGVSWLAFLCKYQLHGILCDDMGLGKSLQTICIVASKHEERRLQQAQNPSVENQPLPSLIVCPPTLVGHWFYEFKKFAPHLRVLRYAGNSHERHGLRSGILRHDIIITSYEAIRTDIDYLANLNWLFCVLDEGHIIKNGKTKLSKAIKMLHANHRLILSGTPIQNNVLELWNLFDFLMPGFLGTEKQFIERYSRPILANRSGKASAKEQEAGILALDALHKQVLPFLLRRLKEDVLDDLPPKIIQDYYCDLSLVQQRLYDEFARSRANAEAGQAVADGQGDQQHIFQTLQYLRRLCNHPWLAINQQTDQLQKIVQRAWADAPQQPPADPLDIVHAPKLVALRQILLDCGIGVSAGPSEDANNLDDHATANHRVLIFCQVKQMLDIIQRDLFMRHMPSVTYMRLDGATEPNKRHDIVQAFNADPSVDVLLLTTQVGGLGLNLTGADTVIFVDHDWNPMKDLQAMDRAHRIGQKRVVNVYRLIMRGTLEEKIMGLQRFKLNIASSVVNQQNAGLATMNTNQVLDLFDVTDSDAVDKKQSEDGPVSQSELLKQLEDLPPEDEYEGLSLDAFMSGL